MRCLLVSATCSILAATPINELPSARSVLRPRGEELKSHLQQTKVIYNRANDKELPEVLKKARKPVEVFDKVMEDPITVMRGELCLSRDSMIGHDKCMTWLVKECTTKSFGTGLCGRVKTRVKDKCESGSEKACEYAKMLGIDVDTDKDGVNDEEDAFPEDPQESKDKDGDKVGDNADEHDTNPHCAKSPCEAPVTEPPASAPPPAAAPAAPAPAAAKEAPAKAAPAPVAKDEEAKAGAPSPAVADAPSAPAVFVAPDAKQPLQSQGFSGKPVMHEDGQTFVGDWGKEYGHKVGQKPWFSGAQSKILNAVIYAISITVALRCIA